MANDVSRQLVEDAHLIVRDLYLKRLEGTLQPMDDAVRRILDACLRRGLLCGEASPEERALSASLGISV